MSYFQYLYKRQGRLRRFAGRISFGFDIQPLGSQLLVPATYEGRLRRPRRRVSLRQELLQSGYEHLHGDGGQDHTHQSLHCQQPFGSEQVRELARHK